MKRSSHHRYRNVTRGWKHRKPTLHQRTLQLKRCKHNQCFLGPEKSYPICNPGTCTRNKKGVHSAYMRARQYHRRTIAKKAYNILRRIDPKHTHTYKHN